MKGSCSLLGKLGAALGLLGLSFLAACGAQNAEAAFASDFKCDSVSSQETMAGGRYRVSGCGHEATYQCVGNYQEVCAIQMVDQGRSSSSDDSDSRPRPRRKRVASEVQVESRGDDAVMVLELVLDQRVLLRVTATPDKRADLVQFKVIRQESSEDADECNLDFMLNGQVIKTPKAVATRNGDVLSHRVQVGRDLIADFGTSEKIALRICKERWGLNREQVQKVRDFMDRFQEEMAWKAPPREGPTGGMLAPSGGWPAWSASAKAPNSSEGTALDPRALFKKLSPSVFKLEGSRGEGTSQGSAVAITTTELVTNCHVVQGALKLVLKQEKQEWAARLVRADPSTDRCVITADGLMMQPVAGVRNYDSLEVGEAVYTLGSPVGLELTLSNGIVSGRREEKKRRYVQTTAPISPGSSGGGLFDARGNLVGVTTLVLVGREHMNQALNFAIPADAFWQP
jgi:S1-C subfamily serine protease